MTSRYTATCGTDSGWYRHRRAHEAACEPCRAAHACAEAVRKARKAGRITTRSVPCVDCGLPSASGRCQKCGHKLAGLNRSLFRKEQTEDIAYRGGWWQDGLIMRPTKPVREAS